MNVTIIHRYFWPESQAAEEPLMLREIVKMHLSRGDSVTVICGAADDCEEIWRKEFPDKVFIKAFRSPVDRSGPMSRRAINALRLLTRSAAEILSSRRIGLIYLFAYPPGVAALIIAMCRLTCRRTKLLFSFQDNLEYRIPYYPVRVAYRAYNRFCISHASMTMPLSEEMKQHLLSTVSERSRSSVAQRITVLNNFYSEHVNIDTITKEKVYDIIYAGNHGPGQNLSHFIEVLALCHITPKPVVVFYGSGTEKHNLIQKAKHLGVSIEFRDPIARAAIAEEIQRSRFGLVGMIEELPQYAFPSKIAAYGCNGTPSILLGPQDSLMGCWIEQETLGHSIDAKAPEKAARELEAIMSQAESLPKTIAKRAKDIFGKERFIASLTTIINDLIES